LCATHTPLLLLTFNPADFFIDSAMMMQRKTGQTKIPAGSNSAEIVGDIAMQLQNKSFGVRSCPLPQKIYSFTFSEFNGKKQKKTIENS
jgi:hypothetical protein